MQEACRRQVFFHGTVGCYGHRRLDRTWANVEYDWHGGEFLCSLCNLSSCSCWSLAVCLAVSRHSGWYLHQWMALPTLLVFLIILSCTQTPNFSLSLSLSLSVYLFFFFPVDLYGRHLLSWLFDLLRANERQASVRRTDLPADKHLHRAASGLCCFGQLSILWWLVLTLCDSLSFFPSCSCPLWRYLASLVSFSPWNETPVLCQFEHAAVQFSWPPIKHS